MVPGRVSRISNEAHEETEFFSAGAPMRWCWRVACTTNAQTLKGRCSRGDTFAYLFMNFLVSLRLETSWYTIQDLGQLGFHSQVKFSVDMWTKR